MRARESSPGATRAGDRIHANPIVHRGERASAPGGIALVRHPGARDRLVAIGARAARTRRGDSFPGKRSYAGGVRHTSTAREVVFADEGLRPSRTSSRARRPFGASSFSRLSQHRRRSPGSGAGRAPAQRHAGVQTVPQRRGNAVVATPAATALLVPGRPGAATRSAYAARAAARRCCSLSFRKRLPWARHDRGEL